MNLAHDWIDQLSMIKHPEGGYYKEIYRSTESMAVGSKVRNLTTSIYFLLNGYEKSHFHQLRSDELWYFHDGSGCKIHMISIEGNYHTQVLGSKLSSDERPQVIIPQGTIFAAEVVDKNSFTLMGCVVCPGFDFEDFKLFKRAELLDRYPQHKEIIHQFTF